MGCIGRIVIKFFKFSLDAIGCNFIDVLLKSMKKLILPANMGMVPPPCEKIHLMFLNFAKAPVNKRFTTARVVSLGYFNDSRICSYI
jgi:hypothetical protein